MLKCWRLFLEAMFEELGGDLGSLGSNLGRVVNALGDSFSSAAF